jgi:hypothetical protein
VLTGGGSAQAPAFRRESVNAVRLAWDAAGGPAHQKARDIPAGCVVCGIEHPRTCRAKDALGKNYDILTARRPDLDTVCEPCAWALAGKPPNTLRMWSILTTADTPLPPHGPHLAYARTVAHASAVKAGGADATTVRAAEAALTKATDAVAKMPFPVWDKLHLCNRAEQSAIITAITTPPASVWACSIAVSGQKHLLPYARINPPGAARILIRFEACDIETTPAEIGALIGACAALRLAGHSPDSIHTVTPTVPALTREGLAAWRQHAPTVSPHAHSPLLGMALHLTTKETLHALADRFTDWRPGAHAGCA